MVTSMQVAIVIKAITTAYKLVKKYQQTKPKKKKRSNKRVSMVPNKGGVMRS